MASVIAIVKLAPGRVGYFDDVTRIHLTLQNPQKPVIEGMNTIGLKKAVKSGCIRIVSGSLEPVAINTEPEINIVAEDADKTVKTAKKEDKKVVKEKDNTVEIIDIKPEKIIDNSKDEENEEIKEDPKEEVVEEEKAIDEVNETEKAAPKKATRNNRKSNK